MAAKRSILQQMLADEDSGPDGLALAGWGFAAVLAFLFAAAAWQFTESPQSTAQRLKLPDSGPVEITGSVGRPGEVGIFGAPPTMTKPSAMEKMLTEDLVSLKRDLISVRRTEEAQRETNIALKERIAALETQLVSVGQTLKATRQELAMATPTPPVNTSDTTAPPSNVATRTIPLSGTEAMTAAVPQTPARTAEAAVNELTADPITTGSIPKSSRTGLAQPRRVDAPPETQDAAPATRPQASTAPSGRPGLLPIDAPLPPIDADVPTPGGQAGTTLPRAKPGSTPQVATAAPTAPPPAAPASAPAATQGNDAMVSRSEFGIDLGGFATMAALKQHWKTFAAENPDLGSRLQPRAGLSEKDGSLEVRLIAGPFVNAADAIVLCAKIGARGTTCQPALFSGQPVPVK